MTTTGSKSGYTPQQILNYQKNDELLLKTKDVQGKTLQSLDRTKKDLYQADKAADKALQNLQDQREKLISIIDDTNRVYSSLERSEELVHKLGYGFRFPAIFQLSETQKKVYSDIIGIYEHQQYSFMSKSWSSSDFFSSQNTSFSVTDVFDPQLTMEDGRFFWVVDISFSHIDSDGWVYGSSFSEIDKGNGKESSQGFVFNLVRRRVWKRNTEAKISKNEEALMRNIQRKQQQQQSSHDNIPSSSKKSVNNNNDITLLMVGTKYVHNDMTSDQEKSLKEIKATDKKIDEGVEEVEKGVDNLLSKAKLANNEMKVQQVLIEEMDENVDRDLTKVKDVNKQLKHKVDNQCSCIIS